MNSLRNCYSALVRRVYSNNTAWKGTWGDTCIEVCDSGRSVNLNIPMQPNWSILRVTKQTNTRFTNRAHDLFIETTSPWSITYEPPT